MEYLDKCVDYKILQKHLTKNELKIIDNEISLYENDKLDKYEIGYIIDWYEGCIDTDEFLEILSDKDYLKCYEKY